MKRPAKRKAAALAVAVNVLPHGEGLALPAYQTEDSAGLDLLAAVPEGEAVTLQPGRHALVPTGLAFALPKGSEAQVRPRSGLAAKFGVTVLNSPGTIDADYRGEVQVILINHGNAPFVIKRGDRIAQMVIAPVAQAQLTRAKTLTKTSRGSGGCGSTGVGGKGAAQRAASPKTARKKKAIASGAAAVKSPTRGKPSSKNR